MMYFLSVILLISAINSAVAMNDSKSDEPKLPEISVKTEGKDILLYNAGETITTEEQKKEAFSFTDYLNAEGNSSLTALEYAINGNYEPAMHYLIKRGANINHRSSEGKTLLFSVKTIRLLTILLKNGAEIDAVDNNGATPLHVHCQNSNNDIIQELVKSGASFTKRDRYNQTPLHYAVLNKNNPKATQALLEAIDKKNAENKN